MITIGKLSEATGVKIPTIRYYEQIGSLTEPSRRDGNQRLYGRTQQERLAFIRHARDLGFPVQAIRELLSLSDDPDQSCAAIDEIAQRQLATLNSRIARLTVLGSELERMLDQCVRGRVADCRVIEMLGTREFCTCRPTSEDADVSGAG